MSDFSAARLQHGESHPSKFRISRRLLEAESFPLRDKSAIEKFETKENAQAAGIQAKARSSTDIGIISSAISWGGDQDKRFRHQEEPAQVEGTSSSEHCSETLALKVSTKTEKKQKPLSLPPQSITIRRKPVPSAMPPPSGPVRFFIASLGNPPPYHTTRHSAGHILLKRLQAHLSLPSLSKSKIHGGGHVSHGSEAGFPQWTLWQSPSQMNISGVPLLKAYKTFLTTIEPEEGLPTLVILHDEMETSSAQLKLRRGPTSPKGHNGIKSVQQTLQGAGLLDKMHTDGQRFLKVAVGIGRPPGGTRDKDDVSAYVLGQLGSSERTGIEGSVTQLVTMLEGEMGRISRGT